MTDQPPTTGCTCTVPTHGSGCALSTEYIDLLSTDTIVVLLRCPDCPAALFGPYGSRVEHGPGPLHTLIPAPSGAESSTIATPSPAEVDYQVLWQNAMDRVARAWDEGYRFGRLMQFDADWVDKPKWFRHNSRKSLVANLDSAERSKSNHDNPYRAKAASPVYDVSPGAFIEVTEGDVDELLGNEISFTPHTHAARDGRRPGMNCPKISPELAEISHDLTEAQRRLAEIADKRVAQRGRIKRAQDVLARLDADEQAVRDEIDGLTQALISRARIEAGGQ